MMEQYYLFELKFQAKLPVIFHPKNSKQIDTIYAYNQDNATAIYQWYEFIDGLKSYISNPVIAWNNQNRYRHLRYGGVHLKELGYDVMFFVKTNKRTNTNYVYVSNVNLKHEEFGLKVPNRNTTSHPNDTTNQICSQDNVVNTNISVDKDGNYVSANGDGADYVSETRFHNILQESLHRLLWKEYHEQYRMLFFKESFNRRKLLSLIETRFKKIIRNMAIEEVAKFHR